VTFAILDIVLKSITLILDMHELSLTQNILDHALKNAGPRRIVRVNLSIGQFSDEREESIRFYWEDLAEGTPAQGAQLHFQRVDAELQCLECNTVFHPEQETGECPSCLSPRLKILSGDDVKLDSIDVD